MISLLDFEVSGPSLSTGWGHCVVFLGKTLNSHSASLTPGVLKGTGEVNAVIGHSSGQDGGIWGLHAISRKKNFPKSEKINPLLTKLFRSRWLDISLILFLVLSTELTM